MLVTYDVTMAARCTALSHLLDGAATTAVPGGSFPDFPGPHPYARASPSTTVTPGPPLWASWWPAPAAGAGLGFAVSEDGNVSPDRPVMMWVYGATTPLLTAAAETASHLGGQFVLAASVVIALLSCVLRRFGGASRVHLGVHFPSDVFAGRCLTVLREGILMAVLLLVPCVPRRYAPPLAEWV